MKTTPSQALSRYLADPSRTGRPPNPTTYITQGAVLVGKDDLAGLLSLLPRIRKKTRAITESDRLRRRLDLLALFFEETESDGMTHERREIAFVLFYFLKGYDMIPDSIPQIGLLDDALLIDTALNRNLAGLRAQWAAANRTFPDDL